MTLLLGIYYKNKGADKALEKALCDNFTLNGQREIRTVAAENLKIWLTPNDHFSGCFESEEGFNLYAGRIYNLKKKGFNKMLEKEEMVCMEGEFTLISYDKRKQTALLLNDFWGLYPLYYTETETCFVFCNEYEPLMLLWDGKPDASAMAAYYILGGVPGTVTFMKNISNLPPHTMVTMAGGKVSFSTMPKPPIPVNREIKVIEAAEQVAFLFRNAVQKRVLSLDFKYDAMLTGGVDTRLILSCLNDEQRTKTHFVSYLTPPLTEQEDTDVSIARQLADRLNLPFEVRRYTLWDKPFGTDYFIYKRLIAAEKYFSGHFGSELLNLELYKASDKSLLHLLSSGYGLPSKVAARLRLKRSCASLFSKDVVREAADLAEWLQQEKNLLGYCENSSLLLLLQMATRSFFTYTWKGTRSIYFDQPAYMPLIFIMPFLDKDLLLFLLSLPEDYLGTGHDKLYNLLFKNHYTELNTVGTNSPLANDPLSVLKPVSTAKTPFDFRKTDYRDSYEKALNNNELNKRYHSKYLDKIKNFQETDTVNKFIDFETWCRYAGLNNLQ